MTPARHDALGQPGETHPGAELDCPECFAALGDAFRPPAVVPPLPPETPDWNGPARTVDLDDGHTTRASVRPFPIQPGGVWETTCTCGWSKAGPYARDGMGEVVAMRLAETWAARHRDNPLTEGNP